MTSDHSRPLILISHFLSLLSHQSLGVASQLRARCFAKLHGFAVTFDMGQRLEVRRWKGGAEEVS